jgi:hypothetical protein
MKAALDGMEGGSILGEFAKRSVEVAVFEYEGSEAACQESCLTHGPEGGIFELDKAPAKCGVGLGVVGQCGNGEAETGEFLADAVMEIMPDAAVFAFADDDHVPLELLFAKVRKRKAITRCIQLIDAQIKFFL